jgi:hypothetical protein
LFAIAQVFTKNFSQLPIDPHLFDLGRGYSRYLMELSKHHRFDQNPESSTTAANATTTEELEAAGILAGLSSGMYLWSCLFKF